MAIISQTASFLVFSCEECSFSTKNCKILKEHQSCHCNDEKILSKRNIPLNVSTNDKTDISVLSGAQRYTCDQCSFSTRRLGSLKSHQNTHTDKDRNEVQEGMLSDKGSGDGVSSGDEWSDESNSSMSSGDVLNTKTTVTPNSKINKSSIQIFSCEQCDYSSIHFHLFKRHQPTHNFGDKLKELSCFVTNSSKYLKKQENVTHQQNLVDFDQTKIITQLNQSEVDEKIRDIQKRKNNFCAQDKLFYCEDCCMSFLFLDNFNSHLKYHSDNKIKNKHCLGTLTFSCNYSGCIFTTEQQENLITHKFKVHSTDKPYQCEQCGSGFSLSATLDMHQDHSHTKSNLLNYEELASQTEQHQGENKVNSLSNLSVSDNESCGNMIFDNPSNESQVINQAKQVQDDGKINEIRKRENEDVGKNEKTKTITTVESQRYTCDQCSFSTRRFSSLKRHQNTHTNKNAVQEEMLSDKDSGEGVSSSDESNSSVSCNESQEIHPAKHVEDDRKINEIRKREIELRACDKPYYCEECCVSFLLLDSFKHHRKYHLDLKTMNREECLRSLKYSCTYKGCIFTTEQQENIIAHKFKVHSKEKPFQCVQCGSGFTLSSTLEVHHKHSHVKKNLLIQEPSADTDLPREQHQIGNTVSSFSNLNVFDNVSFRTVNKNAVQEEMLSDKDSGERVSSSDESNFKDKPYQCGQCGSGFSLCAKLEIHQNHSHVKRNLLIQEPSEDTELPREQHQIGNPVSSFSNLNVSDNVSFRTVNCDNPSKESQVIYPSNNKERDSKMNDNQKQEIDPSTQDKPFYCDECCISCLSLSGFISHRKYHTSIKTKNREVCVETLNYSCNFTGCIFASEQQINLITHKFKVHSTDKPFQCVQCGSGFTLSSTLEVHHKHSHVQGSLKILNNSKMHKCQSCGCSYSKKSYLKAHIHRDHISKPVENTTVTVPEKNLNGKFIILSEKECVYEPFQTSLDSVNEQSDKSSENSFYCEDCGLEFNLVESLKAHESVHRKPTEYLCNVCGKRYETKRQFSKHKLTHTIHICICEFCGKECTSRAKLSKHKEIKHTASFRKYPCQQCSFTGKTYHSIFQHKLTHIDGPKHLCDECGVAFKQSRYLITHKKVCHSVGQTFNCSKCNYTAKAAYYIQTHERKHHQNGDKQDDSATIDKTSVIFKQSQSQSKKKRKRGSNSPEKTVIKPKTTKKSVSEKVLRNKKTTLGSKKILEINSKYITEKTSKKSASKGEKDNMSERVLRKRKPLSMQEQSSDDDAPCDSPDKNC